MAAPSLTTFANVLSVLRDSPTKRAFRRDVPLLNLLKVTKAEGKDVTISTEFSGVNNVEWGNAAMTAAKISYNPFGDASLPIEEVHTFAGADRKTLASIKSYGSSTKTKAMQANYLLQQIDGRMDNLKKILGTALYSGVSASGEIAGVTPMLSDTAYGGLDSTTLTNPTEWQCSFQTHDTTTQGAVAVATIREKLLTPAEQRNPDGRAPSFMTTDYATWNTIARLLDDKERLMVDKVRGPDGGMVDLVSSVGHKGIDIDGVVLIKDRFCPAGYIHGWYQDYSEIKVLPHGNENEYNVAELRTAFRALTGDDVSEQDIVRLMSKDTSLLTPVISEHSPDTYDQWIRISLFIQAIHRPHSHAALRVIAS